MNISTVHVDSVDVGERHRPLDQGAVARLAESMASIGLQNPIQVYQGDGEEVCTLVAGYHRLRAAESLDWPVIPCIHVDLDDIDRELFEIDENLIRHDLTEAEEAAHLARRKELFELRESGKTFPTLTGRGHKGFAQDTADKTGQSKRSVNQKIARAEAIPNVSSLSGTSLDKGVELDALAKMDAEERDSLMARAIAGESVSARGPESPPDGTPKSTVEVSNKNRKALQNAWNKAPAEDREWFLEWIDRPVMDRRYG